MDKVVNELELLYLWNFDSLRTNIPRTSAAIIEEKRSKCLTYSSNLYLNIWQTHIEYKCQWTCQYKKI